MKASGIVAVAVGCLGLAACAPPVSDDPFAHYAQRTDKVTLSAGNASEVNEAIHTIDPWPRYVYDTNIPDDAARLAHAVSGYEDGGGAGARQGASGSMSSTASMGGASSATP